MHLKNFRYLLLAFPILLPAQGFEAFSGNIDQKFLDSLPPNIRGDLLDGANLEDPSIDSPDPQTRITNLEASLRDAEKTLKSIRSEVQKTTSNVNELRRFGHDFFSSYQSTFLPVNEPNLGSEYILDVGDVLTLQLVGHKGRYQRPERIEIKRDGTLNIFDVGKLQLSGKSLQEAENIIQNAVSETYIGVDSVVTLTRLRDMNILMVGNVSQPGLYIMQGGASVIQALFNAGGITELGSYRSILHKRNNKIIEKIDLYNLLAFGEFAFSQSLRSGDSLVVQPKGAEITIQSDSLNSAIYEVLPGETFGDILKFASFNSTRYKTSSPFQLTRADNGKRIVTTITIDESYKFFPDHGDSYTMNSINPYFDEQITIEIRGEVKVPGSYTLTKGAKLSDILEISGGFSDNAYPYGGVFTRESVKAIESQMKDKAYFDLINIVSASPSFAIAASPQGLLTFLSVLKEFEPSGRVLTNFNLSNLKSDPRLNFFLEDKDVITIPIFKPLIYVFGEVMNPGTINHEDGKSAEYYLSRSGGFSRIADQKRVIVIKPNGETFVLENNFFGLLSSENYLPPGSTIYVPKQIGKIDGINLAATVSPIISSLALSLASLNSINN